MAPVRNYNEYTLYREFAHFAEDVNGKFEEIQNEIKEIRAGQVRIETIVSTNTNKIGSLQSKDMITLEEKKGKFELKKVALMGGLPIAGGIVSFIIQKLFFP